MGMFIVGLGWLKTGKKKNLYFFFLFRLGGAKWKKALALKIYIQTIYYPKI